MNLIKREPRSLILCTSPLQMLIAEKIIELNFNKRFDLIVMGPDNNDKYIYYYNKLKKKCLNSLYYVTKGGLGDYFKFITQIRLSYLNRNYQDLYLASLDSRYFQYIVSKNIYSNIFTFDDGTANIISNSLYYFNTRPKFLKRAIWRLFGIKYYLEDIRSFSLLHYTIYENIPNIIDNTRLVKLYTEKKLNYLNKSRTVRIYLGQPLQNISNIFDDSYIVNVIESLSIEYYYPHPKEKIIPIGKFEVIKSSLIFEDYIVEYLKDNLNVEIEVYTFFSGAILNISNLDRVFPKYIYNSYLHDKYKEFYDFAGKNFKISY